MKQRLMAVKQAAVYLGRTEIAVREMTWAGKLPYIRADRRIMFDIDDLDRWIDVNRVVSEN